MCEILVRILFVCVPVAFAIWIGLTQESEWEFYMREGRRFRHRRHWK